MPQDQHHTGSDQPDEKQEHPEEEEEVNYCYNEIFTKVWREITSDNHLTLFGFQRYRTAHLLNLRFIEAEIGKIDHELYQAGLQLHPPLDREHTLDRLGLKQAKRDNVPNKVEEVVDKKTIMRLRRLVKEYGECTPADSFLDRSASD